jgi:hypothetical protein
MKKNGMQRAGRIMAPAMLASLSLTASAQSSLFDFTTTLGNGSLTLSPNVLTEVGSSNNEAIYADPSDFLAFNGTNYDGLRLVVFNDYNLGLLGLNDGFAILAGTGGTTNLPDITIVATGNSAMINGTTISDLLTVLSNFDQFYTGGGIYPTSQVALQFDSGSFPTTLSGALNTFELVNTPEPGTTALFGLGTISFYWWRRGSFHKGK